MQNKKWFWKSKGIIIAKFPREENGRTPSIQFLKISYITTIIKILLMELAVNGVINA